MEDESLNGNGSSGKQGLDVQRLLKWVGTVGGTIVGLGTLAFAAGFLSQRAQYDFAQVPFVFVDYWAYAEVGVTAFVTSIYLLVQEALVLMFIALATIAAILLLEVERFRRAVLRPHFSFILYALIIFLFSILILQQLRIRQLRNEVVAGASSVSDQDTVPAVWPFSLFIPSRIHPPMPDNVNFSGSSVDMWMKIADDLEAGTGRGARYLEIRPRPRWAIPLLDSKAASQHVLGVSVRPSELDSMRAISLYQSVMSAFLLAFWAFLMGELWQRYNLREINNINEPVEVVSRAGKMRHILFLLKEEIWFVSQWVLRPICALLLVTSGVFLLPECYGVLAMPRIGQEYVEVISESQSDKGIDAGDESLKAEQEIDEDQELRQAIALLNRYSSGDPKQEQQVRDEWRQRVDALGRMNSPKAADVLEVMANTSSATAPELADIAQDAWTLVSARSFATREGYILYYPRSETDYLRILQPNPLSHRKRWTIYPVKMSAIVEIRVKREEQTVRLIDILRGMRELDPQERALALYEAEKLGHPNLVEVAIAGTLDPSHHIRGFSITDVGRYASALPEGRDSTLRRKLASRRLLEIIRDRRERTDLRGTAASALHRIVVADQEVCTELLSLLRQDGKALADEHWSLRGSLITAVGELRCRNGLVQLLTMLTNPKVPEVVRSSIPTQLMKLGNQGNSAPTLARLINDSRTPAMVLGPSITAISLLDGEEKNIAIRALCRFLRQPSYGQELSKKYLLSEYRQTAVDSLRQLGHPSAVETLHWLAQRSNEEDAKVRIKAIFALGELSLPPSEAVLIKVFEDKKEEERVRIACLDSLGEFHDNRSILKLRELYPAETAVVQRAIIECLSERASRGAGIAAITAESLQATKGEADEVMEEREGEKDRLAEIQPKTTPELPVAEKPLAATEISIGGGVTGRVSPNSQASLYSFSVTEAGVYRIEVNVIESADPIVILLNAEKNGEILAQDDDGGGGANALIVRSLEAGEYILAVGDLERRGGSFRVSIAKGE